MARDDEDGVKYLIDFLKDRIPYSPGEDIAYYNELLSLSVKTGNRYGQALAYVKFSRIYQDLQLLDKYMESIKNAYNIADKEGYDDILIRYYNLEGIRYMENYDETNAITMYLKGIQTAKRVSDYSLCAVFYNNIAEIFLGNYDYDRATFYYQRAIKTLEQVKENDPVGYRKIFTENIIIAYCLKNDLKNAKKYLAMCKRICSEDHVRPFAQEEVDIRVLLLENKKEKALENSLKLFKVIRSAHIGEHLLFYSYSFLFDVFLEFKKKEEASFCLSALEEMEMEVSQNYVIETQKRKIRYCECFGIEDSLAFKEFYELTLKYERINTEAVSNSLSTAISLYEAQKEKRMIQKEREDLEEIVMYDPLTGVYNRRRYDMIVNECLKDKRVKNIAYIMIDIDYFKEYNDYYGHDRGDTVLKEVALLIGEALPSDAHLARYGGDEFSCLLLNKSNKNVGEFLERILERIRQQKITHIKSKQGEQLTLSLGGYCTYKGKDTTLDILIKGADDALYEMKNMGRNGYKIKSD